MKRILLLLLMCLSLCSCKEDIVRYDNVGWSVIVETGRYNVWYMKDLNDEHPLEWNNIDMIVVHAKKEGMITQNNSFYIYNGNKYKLINYAKNIN